MGTAGALALGACGLLTGCGGTGSGAGSAVGVSGGSAAPAAAGRTTVTVLAAASLTESFQVIEKDYERSHPDADLQISFAASSTIVQQVSAGAPADVVALAGESAATPLPKDLLAKGGRAVIATNTLEIGVAQGNPSGITSLSDLGRPGLKVVLCASSVPCGAAADAALDRARVAASVVSRETDVKATLTKVRLGEADAAVVYHSDVVGARGAVTGIPVPAEANQTLRYPLIWLNTKPTTTDFATYVSTEGQNVLQDNGFGMP